MNRRDAVLSILDGGASEDAKPGYVPAAFFRHFDSACHFGEAAVKKHTEFFRSTGMDFVKIQYERSFPPQQITRPEDWKRLRPLSKEFFEPQLDVVRGLVDTLKSEALVVVTLYSPFMSAGHVGGERRLNEHLSQDPDAVKAGMEVVTESLMVFVRECIKIGVDGFYHSTQGGESRRFASPDLFARYIKPFDLVVMKEIARHCPFNILHICDYHSAEVGGYDDLTPFLDYPGHVVNCNPHIGDKVLSSAEISSLFGRPFMGGMDRKGVLATGTQEQVREAAREALKDAPAGFVLGADCTVPGETPWDNLRVAIEEAHRW